MDQKESFSTMKSEEECSDSKQQRNLWTICDSISSSSKGFAIASSESDCTEEVISSDSSSSPEQLANTSALLDMSSLLQQLPKRGLSPNYHGKSRSFYSISDARCIEDLAKPEYSYFSYKKSLKACKIIERSSETQKSCPYEIRSKKASRGSHTSLSAKMSGSSLRKAT